MRYFHTFYHVTFILAATAAQALAQGPRLNPYGTPAHLTYNSCKAHTNRIEKRFGIPPHLLTAIVQVESGRWNPQTNKAEPWPWSINVRGKSHYFASKSEALKFVKALDAKGIKNFDVGCAQINSQHRSFFPSLSAMLEPAYNIAYAGQILSKHHTRKACWQKAVKYYHSGTPSLHIPYQKKVYRAWEEYKKKKGIPEKSTDFRRRPASPQPVQRLASLKRKPPVIRRGSYGLTGVNKPISPRRPSASPWHAQKKALQPAAPAKSQFNLPERTGGI